MRLASTRAEIDQYKNTEKLETLCLLRMQLIHLPLKIPIFREFEEFPNNAFNNDAAPNPKLHFNHSRFLFFITLKINDKSFN